MSTGWAGRRCLPTLRPSQSSPGIPHVQPFHPFSARTDRRGARRRAGASPAHAERRRRLLRQRLTDDTTINPTFTDCAGAFDGNNKNQEADVLATINADFGLTIQNIFDVSGSAGTSGSFDLSGIDGAFVLALKAGDAFSLYAFSDGDLIDWDTLGVGFINGGG